jgi:peptidoglycan hydrolase-like amidase
MTFGATSLAGERTYVADVTISVFGLFHPRELTVTAAGNSALVVHAGKQQFVLERSSGISTAHVSLFDGAVLVTAGTHAVRAPQITVCGRGNGPVDFELAVPRRISRRYHGALQVITSDPSLTAIVTMDLEQAVASVVAAESFPGTPVEALKAQAVAARSYFVAGRGRHDGFDFCDTTHCQFLRELPAPNSNVAHAVEATRGLVLTHESHPFAAMYTRSCSGRTHTPTELGLPGGSYPYYSTECSYCRSHPIRWSSRISSQDGDLLRSSDEAARLELVRRLGSSAVPSNDFVMKKEGDQVLLEGIGQGHGIGLCQKGAKAMAQTGADFRQILSHYYPNTMLESIKKNATIAR